MNIIRQFLKTLAWATRLYGGEEGGGGGGQPSETTSWSGKLDNPALVPYLKTLREDAMNRYSRVQTPISNPYSLGDTSMFGANKPVFNWSDQFGNQTKVDSAGPIDWSKYFGKDVKNPYSPAYLAEHPDAQFQYQGAAGTKTGEGGAQHEAFAASEQAKLEAAKAAAPKPVEPAAPQQTGAIDINALRYLMSQDPSQEPGTTRLMSGQVNSSFPQFRGAGSSSDDAKYAGILAGTAPLVATMPAAPAAPVTPAAPVVKAAQGGIMSVKRFEEGGVASAADQQTTAPQAPNNYSTPEPATTTPSVSSPTTDTSSADAPASTSQSPFSAQDIDSYMQQNNFSQSDSGGFMAAIQKYNTEHPGSNVSIEQVGAAYGMTPEQTGAWMRAHPSAGNVVPPSATQPTSKWATQEDVMKYLNDSGLRLDAQGIRQGLAKWNAEHPNEQHTIGDVGAVFGKDEGQSRDWMDKNSASVNAGAYAGDTANTLSNFKAPGNVTNPYARTSYTPADYSADKVTARDINPMMLTAPQAEAARMEAVLNKGTDKVSTDRFIDNSNVEDYMNPYQKAATDVAIKDAQHNFARRRVAADASAQQAGAFGGYRQGVENAENQRVESQLESDITAKGRDLAYQQALAAYTSDASRGLGAQTTNAGNKLTSELANQQAGMTTGTQNLSAETATRLANLSTDERIRLANQATDLSAQHANQGASLAAAQGNQQAGLSASQQNQRGKEFAATHAQTSEAQNAQFDLQTQLANLDNQYRAAGVQLTGSQLNAQLAQMKSSQDTSKYGIDVGAAGQAAGQRLSAAEFQTNTQMRIIEDAAKQFGDIKNWPADVIQKAMALLSGS